ncbi:FkbM family methyltransferase [Pseudodesulfovibrio karagichevae]|uniref:FkbM family methyltransferase n=1 Tax=Pseudodesulfovibrio karagichevae TaxID=3239305 RepID=A0ABV4K0P5_9BACT
MATLYSEEECRQEFYRLRERFESFPRFTPVEIRFLDFTFNVPDALSFVYQFRDIFWYEVYRFDRESAPAGAVLDCGANVGLSALWFGINYPGFPLVAYEPDPRIGRFLSENIAANLGADTRSHVEVRHEAVMDASGPALFHSDGADGGRVVVGGARGGAETLIEVSTVRLRDELLARGPVSLLKLDVEGAEEALAVDCSDALAQAANIFIEYHSFKGRPQGLEAILAVLRGAGFRYYVENIRKRRHPFLYDNPAETMDLQLNIYARKRAGGR